MEWDKPLSKEKEEIEEKKDEKEEEKKKKNRSIIFLSDFNKCVLQVKRSYH